MYFLTISGINASAFGTYKYVRVDGMYRFIDAEIGGHKDLITESECPRITASGTINLLSESWSLYERFSSSLIDDYPNAYTDDAAIIELEGLIGRKRVARL